MTSKKVASTLMALMAFATVDAAHAAMVNLSFTNVVQGTMAGSAPWLNVQIQDTATPGTVHFVVSSSLTGTQSLTGLWFDIPTVATIANLTSLAFGSASGAGTSPLPPSAFVSPIFAAPSGSQSGVSSSQNLLPSGVTATQTGSFDLVIRFPNSSPGFRGTSTEMFDLVANASSGLSASSFSLSLPKNGSSPAYYSVASFTNADGSGNGTAYITPSAVPLPGTLPLVLSGFGLLGFLARGRHQQECAGLVA